MSEEPTKPGDAPRPRRLARLAGLSVGELRGVGPKKQQALEELGISSVLDLLMHYPRRYADRTASAPIDELVIGEESIVSAKVVKVSTRRPRGRRAIVEVVLEDGSGVLVLTFFNQAWRARQLQEGMSLVVFGKPDLYRSRLQMTNPIVDLVGDRTGRIVPIYPQSEKAGIASTELSSYVLEALERAGEFADPLAKEHRSRLSLVARTEAFNAVHAPERVQDYQGARRRLAFDELWRLQLSLVMRKRAAAAEARGITHRVRAGEGVVSLVEQFLSDLPFALTGAQARVIEEIAADLGQAAPMHRLLQGDVGSGKTVVALATLLFAVQGGYQGALMVPTEVLAEQHYLAARSLLERLSLPDPDRLSGERPVAVALLTSRTTASERERLHKELRRKRVDLLVGTHALLTEEVRFAELGVVVIDEQHRFGVDQRAALREKGSLESSSARDPDLLVMTATPIPRTAAMTVYGDLDYSVLDELPPSRMPVQTIWLDEEEAAGIAWEKVREQVESGRQAFVVCPLVRASDPLGEDSRAAEESEEAEALFALEKAASKRAPRAAVEEFARLASGELSGLSLGLLHGQLGPREKEKVMRQFRSGEIDVLVATTVVEVGVDVPSASVMVVQDADRFGIAQLHQLRGRVGRGKDLSWCYLLSVGANEDAARRLAALQESTDGFELAEVDLELRGEGTVLGTRQKGRSDLKLASLRRDRDLVVAARAVAESILDGDPQLSADPLLFEEVELFVGEEQAEYLQRS